MASTSTLPTSLTTSDPVNLNPKAQDCYFYFYSTCSKGDDCKFRHCSASRGSEDICTLWRDDVCLRKICAFRHSEMDRQRSVIQCYWETQPTGCLKAHCSFSHTQPRPQPPGFLQRMSEYKLSAIQIKSLDQLQKEKEEQKKEKNVEEKKKKTEVKEEQRKKTEVEEDKRKKTEVEEEKRKKTEVEEDKRKKTEVEVEEDKREHEGDEVTEVLGVGVALDLRKELLRRMLAEQKAFRERQASAGIRGDTVEQAVWVGSPLSEPRPQPRGVAHPSAHSARHRASHGRESSSRNPKHRHHVAENVDRHRNPKHHHHVDHHNSKRSTPGSRLRTNKIAVSSSTGHRRIPDSHDSVNFKAKTSKELKATAPPTSLEAIPTSRDPMDFKVKTLEELRAEKRLTDGCQPKPLPREEKGLTDDCPLPREENDNIAHACANIRVEVREEEEGEKARSKRVMLIRRKMPLEFQSSAMTESSFIPEEFGSSMGTGIFPTHSSPGKSVAVKRLSEGKVNLSEIKRRRTNKHSHAERENHTFQEVGVSGNDFLSSGRSKRVESCKEESLSVIGGVATAQRRKQSVAELKTEILQDLEQQQFPSEDDQLLLEEMALYEEGAAVREGAGSGDATLSDSRNHDDLMLQMEEFM